jgi:hypothetical protein
VNTVDGGVRARGESRWRGGADWQVRADRLQQARKRCRAALELVGRVASVSSTARSGCSGPDEGSQSEQMPLPIGVVTWPAVDGVLWAGDAARRGTLLAGGMYSQAKKGERSAEDVFCVVGEVTLVVEPVVKGWSRISPMALKKRRQARVSMHVRGDAQRTGTWTTGGERPQLIQVILPLASRRWSLQGAAAAGMFLQLVHATAHVSAQCFMGE